MKTTFSPTSDIHIIPSNQSQAHQSHHNDSYLFLQDQNDLDDILSHQSPTLHHFDINDDDNDNDDDNNNHNDNDNYNDTTNHNHTSLSNSFQDKNHVYPARVDIYAPPTRRQSFPVNTVHPLTSNTIINNTHSSTMPSIEVFECDTHSEHHILRLERDVQVLMRKLEASVSRERELEDELERVIEIGSGSDDRDMSLFVNSEMNTSRPISIPKKKN